LALNPGTRLGPFEITAPLGVGGMGEVYRATDTNLKRQVAIKVLPASVASDPERLTRFQREAEVLAALNHPNIAHIHGLEKSDGTIALVMELVEGPTLADRIAKGAIPIDEAVPIAKQIADALEAAHDQGIVHRDLKPANVKVREDGTVKVLDFGLAKALEPAGATSASVSISPTITSPAMTQAGVILGTAAYMAPEQARGKAIDKRADIWAFGCVLFEMLTSRRAFAGEDTTDTLAFVITKEPDWSLLPSGTPAAIRKLLTRCLQKDRSRRLRDMGDVRLDLDEATGEADANGSTSSGPTQSPHTLRRRVFIGIGIAIASMALGAGATAVWRPQTHAPLQRTTIDLAEHVTYSNVTGFGGIAISPDGTHIAYPAIENGKRLLYLRSVDQLESRPIPDTDNAANPFFSYDGQWIGFFAYEGSSRASNKLKKVAIRGGPPVSICDAVVPPGGSWGPDDTIVFATGSNGTGPVSLLQVPAAGGTPKPLLVPDPTKNKRGFAWPDVLPGGKAVLVSATTSASASFGDGHIAILSLENGTVRTILDHGFHARYVPTGHIVYMVDGHLMAVPFDVKRLEVTGAPVPLVEGVHVNTSVGEASFAVSPTGLLIYAPGSAVSAVAERTLVWVDRQGHEQPIAAATPHAYVSSRLSPDGLRSALDARDQENDIWTFDIVRGTTTRFTFSSGADNNPVWTPDGRRIAFASDRDHAGTTNLYIAAADNSGQPARLTSHDTNNQYPTGFSPDGKTLVFMEDDPKTGYDLYSVTVDGDHRVTPLLHTSFTEVNGVVSPGGQWLAYQSNESGSSQIYVRPFPNVGTGGLHQVSTNGGTRPVWARNGRELFYMSGNGPTAIMAVPVELGTNFVAGTPQRLFDGPYYIGAIGVTYDVSLDGKRFLMIKNGPTSASSSALSQFVFVNNWFDELKRLLPTK
jgi:serine/threonine-protein kinase